MPALTSLSLYLHIPFCRHRCAYCDFNTYTSLGDLKEAYALALVREIRQVGGQAGRRAHTIFFGGGTPSLMPPALLAHLLQAIRDNFELAAGAEITLEANPDTVDSDYLAAIRALGANRLSFGAQSAVANELVLLEREHDFATVVRAVAMARAAGFDNLNLDFIYGLPGQSLASWEYTLRQALALAPDHLSLYCLTIEPGTPMERWLKNGRIQPPDPDLAADQYELAGELLAGYGFVHYEISNWARPGRECAHNLTYWHNDEYLGLGAGAHGHAAGYRYYVVKQPRVYIRRMESGDGDHYPWSAAVAEKHQLSRAEAMTDTVITQLRLLQEGLDLAAFTARFGQSLYDAYPETTQQLVAYGLLCEENGRLRLTQRGRFLSNQVFYRFL
ncbi:MAG: radical SAM family heme chaperone HemW [Chloroflexi bacterium]|nr:radical SAM family heme chaperone HemW [Chloroflexota bacterium]MCI0575217.1 radical SAM family heme chaperone HemW [Chloroflexota bacterium]MCI0643823.1 radical SAM family heme chaperone HemW [Chloroflexota bacterium]MCI0726079.1 radical SAM family heme chaperone HemW [Chloroflexota bacterium]